MSMDLNIQVGSSSGCGAGSSMFMDTLRLISDSLTDKSHGKYLGLMVGLELTLCLWIF
jgi:hypothetical protein